MAVSIGDIRQKFPELQVYGPEDAAVFRLAPYERADAAEEGTLWYAPPETLCPQREDVNLALIPDGVREQTLERLRGLLSRDYQRSADLLALHGAAADGVSGDRIVLLCRKIMDNPVWLLNGKMESIAYSVAEGRRLELTTPRQLAGRVDKVPTYVAPDGVCACARYVCRICRGSRIVGFLLVAGLKHPLDLELDPRYVVDICSALSQWTGFQTSGVQQSSAEEFVTSLVEGRLTDPFLARQFMKRLNWPERERYYVLSIQRTAQEQRFPLLENIRTFLKQGIYPYGGYYVAILGCAREVQLSLKDFLPLIHFLEANHMAAGLSNGYSDLVMTSVMFYQSVEAIRTRSLFSGQPTAFARYEDRMWGHLLKIAGEKGIHLMSLCAAPALAALAWDQEHGTEYFKTLAAFLLNGMSFKAASALLYMHRNTTYKRICQIRELFGIDFEDRWEVAKLQFSILILGYLGMIELKELVEPQVWAGFQNGQSRETDGEETVSWGDGEGR